MQPQQLAELAGRTMYERDPASQALGMLLDDIKPGYARMSMPVRADMLNGHGTAHGGYIFMLADSAFAFACNSHNFNTVGAGCSIDYLAPGREGDLLVAEAVEDGRLVVLDGAVAEATTATSAREREGLSWEEWSERLTAYFSHLERLFSPDLFVIGGGVSKSWDKFGHLIKVETEMVPATLQNRAGIVGAALVAHRLAGVED